MRLINFPSFVNTCFTGPVGKPTSLLMARRICDKKEHKRRREPKQNRQSGVNTRACLSNSAAHLLPVLIVFQYELAPIVVLVCVSVDEDHRRFRWLREEHDFAAALRN